MIFSSKLEVCQGHSDESSHNNQNNEDDEQDAVYSVNPVAPNTGKDVVKLYIYRTERQKSSHRHLRKSTAIPWKWWNFSGVLSSAARSLKLSLAILTSNSTQNKQWWCHKCPDKKNHHNGAKRKSSSSSICNCYCVQEAEGQKQRPTEQAPG